MPKKTLIAGLVLLSPMISAVGSQAQANAAVLLPLSVRADASSRDLLNNGLQRSWSKLDGTGRYKTCWMWRHHPELVKRALVQTFGPYGVTNQDVLVVAKQHFTKVC